MRRRLYLLLFFMGALSIGQAQTRKQLEQKRKQKQEEIEQTKKFLNENSNKQKKSLVELQTLSRQIKVRQDVISTAAGEIDMLSNEIGYLEENINKLSLNLEAMKKQYAAMVYEAYKNRNMTDKVAFIFSGKNFNESFQHLNYLQQIGMYSKQKAIEITETQKKLESRIEQLTGVKRTKEELFASNTNQKKELEKDKKDEAIMLAGLKGKEAQLRKDLKAKEAIIRQLDRAIAAAITREIEEAKRRAAEEERKKAEGGVATTSDTKRTSSFADHSNTVAGLALSVDFENNRNKLPWPVDKGYIIRPFGVHPHPTIPHVETDNNGVDIATSEGAIAKSIFKGEVRAVFPVPGMGNAVLISHGNYYSVYCKLQTVNVNVGQKVTIGSPIGVIMRSDDDEKTELHLEIWKGTEKQNPEAWLK
jgi:septal ring factor EnvC (AmiA/AmiB activator)